MILIEVILKVIAHVLTSVEVWKISIPAITAIFAWYFNEKNKRLSDEFIRKERRYLNLLNSLEGFTPDNKDNEQLRKDFLKELQLCWMYCPDEVISSINSFINLMGRNETKQEDLKLAIQKIVYTIRKDLLSRKIVKQTNLKPEDYKHIKFTKEFLN